MNDLFVTIDIPSTQAALRLYDTVIVTKIVAHRTRALTQQTTASVDEGLKIQFGSSKIG